MIVPFFLLLVSIIGVAAALTIEGMFNLILLAGPCVLASMFLLLRAVVQKKRSTPEGSKKFVVIDGSNAMHWKDGTPQIATLREIVQRLSVLGFTPGVVFDANAGYILTGRYQHNAAMGKLLDLPEDRVLVVPKGTPADPTILAAARFLDARVVTNDRYNDWAEMHPELREPGYLIRGGYRAGRLWMDVDDGAN